MKQTAVEWLKILFTPRKEIQYIRMKRRLKNILLMLEEEKQKQKTNNIKQTAVQWLRKELETIPNYSTFYTNNYQWIDSIMNKAKEMEKEQIKDAYESLEHRHGENYYNETFKQVTNKN